MYLLYSVLLALALLVTLPYWLVQMLRSGKYRAGLGERFGRVPERMRKTEPNENCIWIHAVSVGEVLAISGLVTELRRKFPEWRIAVSTTTLTGQKLARERFGEENAFYLPLDFRFALRPYFEQLNPKLVVLAETEFWPNFLRLAKARSTRVAVVNARISDRSFPRYRRFRRLLTRVLGAVDLFLAQSKLDRDHLEAIGADSNKLQVSGNLKFDVKAPAESAVVRQLKAAIPADSPVLVCGSTVEGEEEMLLGAFKQLQRSHRNAVMVLAPRHPERFDSVARQVSGEGINFIRRSAWNGSPISGGVLLLDTIGELAAIYSLATLAFVGGSLVPRGGHNILEPAQFGKPILVGPHTENFRDIIAIFAAENAVQVISRAQLTSSLHMLLENPAERELLGRRAQQVFASHSGATQRTLDALEVLLWMPSTLREQQVRA
jgi:3-deoxy-D-manno-octulosonic-acid transferase